MLCTYRGTCKGLQLRHFYWPEVPPQKFCQDIWQLYLRKFTKNGKLLEMELGNSYSLKRNQNLFEKSLKLTFTQFQAYPHDTKKHTFEAI